MAKSTIHILSPSGHRRKVQISGNSSLLQILEEVSREENVNASDWGFMHQRQKCDLTVPWRLLNIPSNAVLEMYKLEIPRAFDDIHVQLQLPDNSRYSGWFEPTVNLQEMLDWFRIQPDSMIAALDISMMGSRDLCPVCGFMREEIVGDYALSNTTLRDLGLTSGTAVIRYNVRSIGDDELRKINAQIDDKIGRRQTQSTTEVKAPSSDSVHTQIKPPVSVASNESSSIFRDPPMSDTQIPKKTTISHGQTRTLAEELGIRFSLDPEPMADQRERKPNELQSFKFSPATKGKDLLSTQTWTEKDDSPRQHVKACDRHVLAYDVSRTRRSDDKSDAKSEEPPDKFYDLTTEDLRSVLETLHHESSNDIPLQTQALRDRAQAQSSLCYEQIAIRFVVNSRYIIQGLFRPDEPVSRLIEFVHTYLVCRDFQDRDFHLYTSPPRMIFEDLNKTLSDYNLAPSAFVYLGHRTKIPLHIELSSKVPIRTLDEANRLVHEFVFRRTRKQTGSKSTNVTSERPSSSSATLTTPRTTTPRKPSSNDLDDKQLRDKLRKFLPPRK